MHELAVTENILSIAERHARQSEALRVTDLYLTIGKLSSIVDDSVQFYWEIVSQGTLCEGSRLHFQRVPAKLACLECGSAYTLDGELTPCPACGSAQVKVTSGDQFFLDSIEIERDGDRPDPDRMPGMEQS
jgi:hydrogenase nickel incorporation protein HypA/HybF